MQLLRVSFHVNFRTIYSTPYVRFSKQPDRGVVQSVCLAVSLAVSSVYQYPVIDRGFLSVSS